MFFDQGDKFRKSFDAHILIYAGSCSLTTDAQVVLTGVLASKSKGRVCVLSVGERPQSPFEFSGSMLGDLFETQLVSRDVHLAVLLQGRTPPLLALSDPPLAVH